MINNIDRSVLVLTAKARADKAINSLKGILLGINLDGEVNELEIKELRNWVEVHKDLINRNPFKEFMMLIEEAVTDNLPLRETIEDLYWLCQKYESDSYYYNAVTTDLQVLQGLCHGILSDGIINDKEIHDLNQWLQENEHLNTYYPYDEIRSLILSIIADHKIDEEEKRVLKAFFSQFVDLKNPVVRNQIDIETDHITISALCTSEPNVIFEGKTFCVTGILQRGNRESLFEDIRKLGGIPTDSVTRKTDYLVVGDNGNQAWAFACYGRKVEKAQTLRKAGHTIVIIHEFDFADIVDDLISGR